MPYHETVQASPPIASPPPLGDSPDPARPKTSHSVSKHMSHWVAGSRDFASRAASRASFSSNRPLTSYSKRRPSISAPSNFRRVTEPIDLPSRRVSFRPLELSICLPSGQLSPLPDFNEDWDRKPAELAFPPRALVRSHTEPSNFRIQRKPVSSTFDNMSLMSRLSRNSVALRQSILVRDEPKEEEDELLAVSLSSSPEPPEMPEPAILPYRAMTHANLGPPPSVLPRTPSPMRARSNTEPVRILRRRESSRRLRDEVDEEIRELNTIIEERRADAIRSGKSSPMPSPLPGLHHHVPALAPSYKMHVRSETLSDIGSAFSMPLVSKPLPDVPELSYPEPPTPTTIKLHNQALQLGDSPSLSSLSGSPPTPSPLSPSSSHALARLSQWIRNSIVSPTRTSSQHVPSSPFYKCTDAPLTSHPQPLQEHHHTSSHSLSTLSSLPSLSTPNASNPTLSTMSMSPINGPCTPLDDRSIDGFVMQHRKSSSRTSTLHSEVVRSRAQSLSAKRARARGLSLPTNPTVITTTRPVAVAERGEREREGPPAYAVNDPHPSPLSPVTPSRVGLAY